MTRKAGVFDPWRQTGKPEGKPAPQGPPAKSMSVHLPGNNTGLYVSVVDGTDNLFRAVDAVITALGYLPTEVLQRWGIYLSKPSNGLPPALRQAVLRGATLCAYARVNADAVAPD